MLLLGDGQRKLREEFNSRTLYYIDAEQESTTISKHHDERS
jgi:hypothetical protein